VKWLGVVVLVLALAGCTATSATPSTATATPSTTSTKAAVPALTAVAPTTLDEKTAEAETERIAAAIEALIDPSDIVHIDKHAQVVTDAESSATFYGSLLTLTLTPTIDPVAEAKDIVDTMTASGWAANQTQDDAGVYLTALTSAAGWFVLVGGDSSTAGQSVVTLQLASPDLP
jgi:glucose/arabinose dehydrogenase